MGENKPDNAQKGQKELKHIDFSSPLAHLADVSKRLYTSCMNLIDVASTPQLNVAIISYYFKKPCLSGVGIHAQNLAKFLVKNNCKVHVFCSGEEDGIYKEDGIIVHTIGKILIPIADKYAQKRLEADIFESEVVKEVVRENAKQKFDIVHTHGGITKAAFILKKVYDTKWIHTFHAIEKLRVKEMSKVDKQFKDLITWVESTVNYCDGAIFVSKQLMKDAENVYRIKSKTVIPNGVDLSLFEVTPITKKNVLFIGRFSKEKGIDLIPEVILDVMTINDSSVTIVCPSKALQNDLVPIQTHLHNLEKQFPGRVKIIEQTQTQEELRELYKECQVYIQPSKYESFGLCIVEAMATSRPVVAFKVGGIPEVIGDAGIMVKTPKELITSVKELLKSREKCASLGKKAAERAKMFDWDVIAKKTIDYYKEVRK